MTASAFERIGRSSASAEQPRFLLVIEWDLSLTTGYSINERESTVALLDQFSDRLRVLSPEPAFPEQFRDPRIGYVRSHRRHHPLHYGPFAFALRRRMRQIIADERPSALIFRPGPMPVIPAWAARQGHPVILKKLGGYRRFEGKNRPLKMRVASTVSHPLFRYITRMCVAADVESHAYMEWLPRTFDVSPTKLRLIRNAANTSFFTPVDRQEARTRHGWGGFHRIIGYVGALDSLRSIEAAVAAAIHLRDVPNLGFVLVGRGPSVDALRQRVAAAGLTDRILFPGFKPYVEVPSVISAMDIALDLTSVPFQIGSTTIVGSYSQKIAQYLACGVPVVAWDTQDTRFLEEHRVGRTVAGGDVAELVETLREVLSTLEGRSGAVAHIREFAVRELSAEGIATKRMAFWEEAVRGGTGVLPEA